jgi:hypothetical protein
MELTAAESYFVSKEGLEFLSGNDASALGKTSGASEATFIAERPLDELRKLKSPQFNFKKLIRLCEEININYREGCYLGTAMLTRGLLDHVPPVFGKSSFAEVASNYGGKSFKGTMQHLQSGARNIADGHLHEPIREKETLPEPQQVDFRAGLDALVAEIVRISQ